MVLHIIDQDESLYIFGFMVLQSVSSVMDKAEVKHEILLNALIRLLVDCRPPGKSANVDCGSNHAEIDPKIYVEVAIADLLLLK